jgi:hypothetical protein
MAHVECALGKIEGVLAMSRCTGPRATQQLILKCRTVPSAFGTGSLTYVGKRRLVS